ncbi:MAG: DUF3943 domain-containing protein [Anaeromyxobacter sp.]
MRVPTLLVALALPAAAQVPEVPAPPQPGPAVAPLTLDPQLVRDPPRNYWLPVLEGPIAYNLAQTLVARTFSSTDTFDSTWDTFVDALDGPWWYDQDKFTTNQFGHPYQGSVYHTAGRSLGLDFWESFLNAELGSFLWETGGGTEPPSVNDQIATPIAGSLLGEVLFRMAYRIVDVPGGAGFWREAGAFAVSPATGVNRAMFQDRYRFQDLNQQPWYGEGGAGVGFGGQSATGGVETSRSGGRLAVRGELVNGLPGGAWTFRRPMDHFDARLSGLIDSNSTTQQMSANLTIRGLLLGTSYGRPEARGLWGMFGAYDFLTPGTFRVSSCNVTVGTVGQRPLGGGLTLQGTAYAGVGFGAGGSLPEAVERRDYHLGLQGVSLFEGKLFWAERYRLRLGARGYYISGKVSPGTDTFEGIAYASANLTARLAGPHALSAGWTGARRRAQYPDQPDVFSHASEWTVSYLYVNDPGLGRAR